MRRPSFAERIKKFLLCILCCGYSATRPIEVFLSHRGEDTKHNVAVLLYDNLMKRKINAFLDFKSMTPGDNLTETIDSALSECKIGVILFSAGYCGSRHCMYELARLVEMKKTVIPVFCDFKAKQLQLTNDTGNLYDKEAMARFGPALEAIKNVIRISFNTSHGDWLKLIEDTSAAVIEKLSEIHEV